LILQPRIKVNQNLYDIFYKRFDKKKYNRKEFINKNNVSVRKKKFINKNELELSPLMRRPATDQKDSFNEAILADAGDYPSADISSRT
jgi:hypothetical protein